MSPEPSIEEFAEVFLHSRAMKGPRAKILRAHFDSPDYIATMSQLAQKVGYQNFNAANLQYGKLAKHLSKEIHWNEKETSKAVRERNGQAAYSGDNGRGKQFEITKMVKAWLQCF